MELTRFIRVFAAVCVLGTASVTATMGQSIPAEMPSPGFSGMEYVDSRGCAFVRVGSGPNTQWVPRIGRDRSQICGLASTATSPVTPPLTPVRSVATTPRPMLTQPRTTVMTPRSIFDPQGSAATPSDACATLPAGLRPYFMSSDARCGPQAVYPGDAARGVERTSAGQVESNTAIRQIVRYQVNPPEGYRVAWQDDRLNPYRGLGFAGGQRQMEQVWTNTLPRRLLVEVKTGVSAGEGRANRPARMVRAELTVIRP